MYGVWFKVGLLGHQFQIPQTFWNSGLCILLIGITIKLMDDWLDQEFDECVGKKTVARKLGKSALPYSLLLAVLSAVVNPPLAISLFLASYSVGMAFQFTDRMPTGLPGYGEAAISFVVGCCLIGVPLMGWGIVMMLTVQLLDDILDSKLDKQSGQQNFVVKVGIVEGSLLFFLLFVSSILLNAFETCLVLIAMPIIALSQEWRG
ncbi:MAG: hypothetical protein JWN30_554 [Bacilli bacterium]|nr:hypothetical protein [Bacilli bacterium]